MNDLDLCMEVVYKAMSPIASHLPLNISETFSDRDSVPKDRQKEMAYGESNGHVTDDSVLWGNTVGYPSDSLASCLWLPLKGRNFKVAKRPVYLVYKRQLIEFYC